MNAMRAMKQYITPSASIRLYQSASALFYSALTARHPAQCMAHMPGTPLAAPLSHCPWLGPHTSHSPPGRPGTPRQ